MAKKIPLIILVFISIISVVFILFTLRKPTLKLTVNPADSMVLIDGAEIKNKNLNIKLNKGVHQIQVVKDGFRPYQQEITIKESVSQKIILIPIDQMVVEEKPKLLNIAPYFADMFQLISDNVLVAINKNNSFLVKITASGVTTLYPKPVYVYSYVYPFVALIEKDNLNKIALINIENNQTKTFDAKLISPVISLTISIDAKKLFILGKQNSTTRSSVLYLTTIENFAPDEIGSFVADSIQSLPDNKIFFSLSADALDLSKFSVYDLKNSKYLFQTKGSGALISPSYNNLVIYSSDNIEFLPLNTTKVKNYPFSFNNQKVFWKDDNTLGILTNKLPGISISLIDLIYGYQTSNIEIPQLDQISVRFILGYYKNTLYVLDTEGKIWSIDIPQL